MTDTDIRVLVIEDDSADALYLEVCLNEAGISSDRIRWATSLADGIRMSADSIHCVLVDLGLPDASGMTAVETMLEKAPDAAIIVLTGLDDPRVATALAAGAQDYLTKGGLVAETLGRSIRYAVDRKSAEKTARHLTEAALLGAQNQRMARGLLPSPAVRDTSVDVAVAYLPAGNGLTLGGDFVDAIECADGTLRLVIGDVMGHGPDQAAIGVQLRSAWRSLALADLPQRTVLSTLHQMVGLEAPDFCFVTTCDVTISADRSLISVVSAGHPPPIVVRDRPAATAIRPNPPLGVEQHREFDVAQFEVGGDWRLLLYTDGLLDCFRGERSADPAGLDGLVNAAGHAAALATTAQEWMDGVLGAARQPIVDDLAVLMLACDDPGETM